MFKCCKHKAEGTPCQLPPDLQRYVSKRSGFEQMKMRGKEYKDYCYVSSEGFADDQDFIYWFSLSMEFNNIAKYSKK